MDKDNTGNLDDNNLNKPLFLNENQEENLEQNIEPIDGQIGIEELCINNESEEEEEVLSPIENQISLDEILSNEPKVIKDFFNEEGLDNNENGWQKLENKKAEDKQTHEIINKDDSKAINDFFKTDKQIEKEKKYLEEKSELNKFFENENVKQSEKANEESKVLEYVEKNNNNLDENLEKKRKDEEFDFMEEKNKQPNKNKKIEAPKKIVAKKGSNLDSKVNNTLAKEVKGVKKVSTDRSRKTIVENDGSKSVKSFSESEEFFLNNDNSEMVKEIDEINKEISDVNLNVGKNAFADYTSESIKTESVKEEEISEVKEKVISEDSGEDVVDGMLYKNLDTVLHESMIPYSEHVILDRAIPRVEDGLKPVQRRILYSMIELGVTPDKPFRKSARIVGDCLGKYHPHGDSSVYDAMVRLAQPFNTNMLLVEGHGNFGSVDGDGAAAMRYTEARLAPLALELLRDLDKNTVRWGLNFDDTLKEPEILPGRFPNLLVNGSTGIAVGLATNIPPHNLAETIDGVVAYIDNPNITLKEMLKIIKGPDFPTGGFILNSSEIKEAYSTGRGRIFVRAKMHIETNNSDKKYLVVTELPYGVNKASLLQKINSFKEEDKYGLSVISEVRDESDRDGLRAVIKLKKDANVKKVYDALIKYTELQTTFGVNMVAIANGKPKQMGLLDIISYYTEYQREIILRRSKYECEQAKEREHILSGLLIAIKNIDAVVKIIKTSKNTTEAKSRLREKFYLTDRQAQAILDMRLARLTSLEVFKLEEEIKKLRELIKKLTNIINSKKEQLKVVREEILQIKREHKRERKTKILRTDDTLKLSEQGDNLDEVKSANQPVVILKNAFNNFKVLTLKQFNASNKEFSASSSLFEAHTFKFETDNSKILLAFSSLGNCFKVAVKDFGESRYKDKGINERVIFKELTQKETIVALLDFEEVEKTPQKNLLFLTRQGMIKKTALSEYALLKKYFQAMKLKENDEILTIVKEPESEYNFIFVTKLGMVLKAENKDVPLQGRISGGVKGMAFSGQDTCAGAFVSNDEGEVMVITDKGYSKRVVLSQIDKMVRYRKGLKIMALSNETGKEIVFSALIKEPVTIVSQDETQEIYFKSSDLVPIETRIGKGKMLDKTKKKMQIKQVFSVL